MSPNSPLIDLETFKDFLKNDNTIILDASIDKVNKKLDDTNVELIPNSLYFDIEGSFSDHTSPFPHTMVNATTFEKEVQKLGINRDSIIVIYDRWGIYSSPRAWWMFRYMGHEQVYVLNGGLPAWKANNFPITSAHITANQHGDFIAEPQQNWFVSRQELSDLLGSSSINIIDARSQGRFEGTALEPRPGLRSGHIPGSSNLPFDQILDGISYKSDDELKILLNPHVAIDKQNIFSCGSGISAAILALAAYQHGYTDITVYDGSWAEWGADPNLPIE